MAKLYPPHLDGTVPSFYSIYPNSGTGRETKITIPFALNKTVGSSDIQGFAIKIKTIQSNTLLWTDVVMLHDSSNTDKIFDYVIGPNSYVTFNISELNLTVGQYYKVQLAFVDETRTVGYYSSTAVAKYTTKPALSIAGLNSNATNNHLYSYTGIYSQVGGDATEKMSSSRFVLKEAGGEVIVDSGDIIHHTYDDVSSRESHETFVIPNELESNKSYYLTFTVTTNNGLVVESARYRIIKAGTVLPDMDVTLSANLNYEEGFVDLILTNNLIADNSTEKKVTGMFYILRAASNDDWAWRDMGSFTLQAQIPSRRLWKDYSIEQGVKYRYAIQQYNVAGLRSDRIEAPEVTADFEDAFLYDGKRQLKIKYNPKVSSFKRDVVEQKTDTIGSKYPFIFRNGNIDYHEFPISGLISYLGDENHQFMKMNDLGIEVPTTQLVSENITAERTFKMEVLKWLTNGEPKLFKSPSEGNFIVRLLNVSLSPNDTLGRMLHTFSATAYEVADASYESLMDMGFAEVESDVVQTRYQSVNIAGHSNELDLVANSIMNYKELDVNMQLNEELISRINNSTYYKDGKQIPLDISKNVTSLGVLVISSQGAAEGLGVNTLPVDKVVGISQLVGKITYAYGQLNKKTAYSVDIREARPGTIFFLDDEQITIGASGSYYVELPTGIKKIILPKDQPNLVNPITRTKDNPNGIQDMPTGIVTYSYKSDMANIFDLYTSSRIDDYPVKMWFGTPTKTTYNPYLGKYEQTHDIIKCIEDVKTSIVKIFKVKISPRYVQQVFEKNIHEKVSVWDENLQSEVIKEIDRTAYFFDMDCTLEMTPDMYNPAYIYQLCIPRTDYTYEEYYKYTQWFTDANFRKGYYMSGDEEHPYATPKMLDGLTREIFYADDTFYSFDTGDGYVELKDHEYILEGPDLDIKSLIIGKGLVCEMSYQTRVMVFSCEDGSNGKATVASAKKELLESAYKAWEKARQSYANLSDDVIKNNPQLVNKIFKDCDNARAAIDKYYADLIMYVAIEKKEFEEEMKS